MLHMHLGSLGCCRMVVPVVHPDMVVHYHLAAGEAVLLAAVEEVRCRVQVAEHRIHPKKRSRRVVCSK
jgi:hypothetical protein